MLQVRGTCVTGGNYHQYIQYIVNIYRNCSRLVEIISITLLRKAKGHVKNITGFVFQYLYKLLNSPINNRHNYFIC